MKDNGVRDGEGNKRLSYDAWKLWLKKEKENGSIRSLFL